MKPSILFRTCLLILSLSTAMLGYEQPQWSVKRVGLQPESHNEIVRKFTGIISSPSHGNIELSSDVPLNKIGKYFIAGDKLALLGEAGNADAVVIFDLISREKIDWFYCYRPQQISPTGLAFIEFYPNHSPANFTDVVLLYDLLKTPKENRLGKAKDETIPAGNTDSPVEAGIPVYPETQAAEHSYSNVLPNDQTAQHVLTNLNFVLIDPDRLAFISVQGKEFPGSKSSLVLVDLSKGIMNPAIETLALEIKQAGKKSGFGVIRDMKVISPGSLRLYFAAESGIDSIVVDLARMANKDRN